MSYYDYVVGRDLASNDPPFYALIMAAMRRADTENAAKLAAVYPDLYAELLERYNAPGGMLAGEGGTS